ncbi:aminotransferase class V-fold PLP-dependent enzyme, partial [Paramuricea clavata]
QGENAVGAYLILSQEIDKLIGCILNICTSIDCGLVVIINAYFIRHNFDMFQQLVLTSTHHWDNWIAADRSINDRVSLRQTSHALILYDLGVDLNCMLIISDGPDLASSLNNVIAPLPNQEAFLWNPTPPRNFPNIWEYSATIMYFRWVMFLYFSTTALNWNNEQHPRTLIERHRRRKGHGVRVSAMPKRNLKVSHLTGIYLPSTDLCKQIHKKNPNTHVHVDAAQSWGVFNHDVQAMECDSFSGGAHKWFLGPKETGMLYMKKRAAVKFWPKDIGYTGKMEAPPKPPTEPLASDASRFEMIGQRNDTNLIGLLYTADILGLIGFDVIQARIKFITGKLREGLQRILAERFRQPPFIIETPSDTSLSEGILVIKFVDRDPSEPLLSTAIYDALYEDYKIAVSTKKGNRMRFSPHIYNTEDHVTRCVDAIYVELKKLVN